VITFQKVNNLEDKINKIFNAEQEIKQNINNWWVAIQSSLPKKPPHYESISGQLGKIESILTKLLHSRQATEQILFEVSQQQIRQSIEKEGGKSPYLHIINEVFEVANRHHGLKVFSQSLFHFLRS